MPTLATHLNRSALLILLVLTVTPAVAQRAPESGVPTYVDGQGVFRWSDSGEEVALFGVNYSTAFAYAFRAHERIGVDRRQAIDVDVAHLSRLGLDAFRIHVWDREVSDKAGNLLDNEHMALLDYLIARLSERGIKTILTPIAWWPSGYPEPDPGTSGLTDGYSKAEMSLDPVARQAQVNYLDQFIRHVNPHRGMNYRDDPDVIAIEIFNEPNHGGTPAQTSEYVNALAGALRDAGLQKPIFYNISEGYSDPQGHAVCAANIEGISVQWYPTGLVRGQTIESNPLPNVDHYPLPFADFPECQDKARMVYEFDAADVGAPIMYPAMARAFRGAGFQWATQFAYDPLAIAYSNTEYQTHFLNLVYTPAKAVSFMIAGEVFRRIPRGASFGTYPESSRFGPFRVSAEEGLSEMAADDAFYYSGSTSTIPPSPDALRRVAGVGSSSVVSYEGTGAYFLDQLSGGVWRLEVYPDAVQVVDPFSQGSLEREAVRLVRTERLMSVRLPDLGLDFSVQPRDEGNRLWPPVAGNEFAVSPGVYVLTRDGLDAQAYPATAVFRKGRLGEFHAPPASAGPTVVRHEPPAAVIAGSPFAVHAQVISTAPVDSVEVIFRRAGDWRSIRRATMQPRGAFDYSVTLTPPADRTGSGEYTVTVHQSGEARTYPADATGVPFDWDYTGSAVWQVPIVSPEAPTLLFDAARDRDNLLIPNPWQYVPFQTDWVTGSQMDRLAVRTVVESFEPSPHHFALRTVIPPAQRARRLGAVGGAVLRVRLRATGTPGPLDVGLVLEDGSVWGSTVPLNTDWTDVQIPVSDLSRSPLYLLPRPYPQFPPYAFTSSVSHPSPDLTTIEGLQFSMGGSASTPSRGFEVERAELVW